jgi:hypothetical protein
MMHDEYAPRLRHYWVFSRWLERSAKIPRIKANGYALVSDTSALPGPGTGRAHAFRLPPGHTSPYRAIREAPRFRPGRGGRGRLYLYLLGDDYDVFNLQRSGVVSGIDAVLHWDVVIYVRRRPNAHGDEVEDKTWFHSIDDIASGTDEVGRSAATAKRCFVAELDTSVSASELARVHVRKVLVYVLPRITFSAPTAADFRVHLRLPATAPDANITDLHDPSFRRRKIHVHTDVPGRALLRYMMGMGADAAHPGAKIRIISTPLAVGPSFSIGTTALSPRSLGVVHGARTPGSNDFDGRGSPASVARNLADAINDPKNDYSAHLVASVSGSEIRLEAQPAGRSVKLSSPPRGTSIAEEWGDKIQPSELEIVADWLGKELGATYRMKVYE